MPPRFKFKMPKIDYGQVGRHFVLPGAIYSAQGIATDAGVFGSPFWTRMANGEFNEAQRGALLANLIAAGSMAGVHFAGHKAIKDYGGNLSSGRKLSANLLNTIGVGLGGEYVMTSGVAQKYIGAATAENARSTERNTEAQRDVAKAQSAIAAATEKNTEAQNRVADAQRRIADATQIGADAQSRVADAQGRVADATDREAASTESVNNLAKQRLATDIQVSENQLASAQSQLEASRQGVNAANISAAAAKVMPWVAGTLGAGGLLLAGLGVGKYLMSKPPKPKGTIRLKMPGKKGDPESTAEVELPLNMPKMSPSLVEGLDRAVRLRTRKNIRANSYKKDPVTGKLIPYDDWEEKYGKDGEKLKNPSTDNPLATFFKDEVDSSLPKAASVEFNEGVGATSNTIALYQLGKLLGPTLAANVGSNILSPESASALTGVAAAALPLLGGHIAGKIMPARTAKQQEIYDSQGNGILNYTVPGYAMYQAARRAKSKAMNGTSGASESSSRSDDDDDDYDWDKEASVAPAPPEEQDPSAVPAPPVEQNPSAIDYSIFRGHIVPGELNRPAAKVIPKQNTKNVANNMHTLQTKLNVR